ncbi:MAG: hypothetical protein FJW63_00730 [Actinobacteria bacterium]|nr:hypothetical protein [Actinomycetota bacterium]
MILDFYTSEEPVYLYYAYYYFPQSENFIKIKKEYNENNKNYYIDLFKDLKDERIWIIFPFNTPEENTVLDMLNLRYMKFNEFKSTASIYLFNPN